MTSLSVDEIWRYPVKSMQGERVDGAQVTDRGIAGDRGWVVFDAALARVGSAKHPRLWGRLLHVTATYVDEPHIDGPLAPVCVTLPDGAEGRSDDGSADAVLSGFLGRPVALLPAGEAFGSYLAVWPEMDGVMPDQVRASERVEADERTAGDAGGAGDPGDADEGTLAQHGLSLGAPPGTAFDVTALHIVTTATLDGLSALAPATSFEPRRFRPNIVLSGGSEPFAENDWPGAALQIGEDGLVAPVLMPTMRCIMTTLDQPGLARDNGVLKTLTAHNRVDIPNVGTWSCAGAYAVVAAPGAIAIGDSATLVR